MNQNLNKAILFFSRTAEEEASYKRFQGKLSKKGNVAISQSLIDSTLETISESNYPLISCYSSEQKGETFGARIANAIEGVFAKGYEQVVVLGNDCPSIKSEDIENAFESMTEGRMTLGPAKDGGVYLLGLNKDQYVRSQFVNLNWNQSNLQESFIDYVNQIGRKIEWLDELQDINTDSDFVDFINELPKFSKLRLKLKTIVAGFQKVLNFLETQNHVFHIKMFDLNLRGPPVVA